jgi:hypothetical protein
MKNILSFCRCLGLKVWINPLEKKYLSEEDSRSLFSNIAIIKQFNESLLKDLHERMKDWNDETTQIGDILVKLVYFSFEMNE